MKIPHLFRMTCLSACFASGYLAPLYSDRWDTLETWPCTYLQPSFTNKIDKNQIRTIVELGGYNGLDSILLHLHYRCPVYTFECDPTRTEEIAERFKPYPDLTLVPMGGWSKTGEFPFYIAGHPGASSFYPFNMETMSVWNAKPISELADPVNGSCRMRPTTVKAIRLDEWMASAGVKQIDLLCIDVQGAALEVLKGLGDNLRNVKYIITEVEYKEIYQEEDLFQKIHEFMKANGFKCYFHDESQYFNDVLFINNN